MAHSCPSDWTDHTSTTACAKHPGVIAVAIPYLTTTILAVAWQTTFFPLPKRARLFTADEFGRTGNLFRIAQSSLVRHRTALWSSPEV